MAYKIEDFKDIDFNERNEHEEDIIEFCSSFKSIKEILEDLEIDEDIESLQFILDEMVNYDLLLLRYPNDINHPKQKYKYNKPVKDETKQTRRVLELINKFNRGEKVCIEKLITDAQYAYDNNGSEIDLLWFNVNGGNRKAEKPGPVSEKTIRRDIDIIKHHFPRALELITGEKGCYKSLNKNMFDNFLNPEALSLMIQTFNIAQRSNMFDSFDISEDDKKILKKKAQEKSKVYEFKNRPFEHIEKDLNYFHIIEKNIKEKRSLIFKYQTNNENIIEVTVKPYKILFMNDNFYVACAVDNEFLFTYYRISKIKDEIKETGKRFVVDPEIEAFIKDIQTPFSRYSKNYKTKMIEIIIEVHKDKAFYFTAKNYLSSQKILETKENGNIFVKYLVTQEMEIEELIKKWIPHVKVISPVSLKEKIEKELRDYLNL